MKKTLVLLTLVFLTSLAFAQKGKVTSAASLVESGKIDEALETIELTIDPNNEKAEKTIPWPRTWEVRGDVYQAIYNTDNTEYKKLSDDPLTVALQSYLKAVELDEGNKLVKTLKNRFIMLQQYLTDQAVNAFNTEDYDIALRSFEQIIEVNEVPFIKADNPNVIDTVILFNTGLAAFYAEKYEKAIDYYKKVADVGYNKGKIYISISASYKLLKDTASALEAIQEGFQKYPDDNDVLTEMISIYLQTNKKEEAMKYLELAIEKDPSNAQFYFAKGSLNDELNNDEEAIASYKKATEIDDTFFNAYFNLGAFYYNKGVTQYDIAREVPANENEKYEEELAKCDKWWDLALPNMEKCYELATTGVVDIDKPTLKSTMETLKNLYYRMLPRDNAKWKPIYDEMDAKIKAL